MLRLVAVALFAMTGYAHASCANYIDGSMSEPPPLVELCFGDDCEMTRQEWICTTANSVFSQYSNGLVLDSIRDDKLYGKIDGELIPDDKLATLTCRAIDDNLDACSPL